MATPVEIALIANTDKLVRGLRRGTQEAGRFVKKLEANRARLRTASLVLTAAFGAQLFAIKKLADAAGVQEKAEDDLHDALIKSGVASRGVGDALIAQAAALQQTTVFGDEAIIGLQALLVTYGVTTDKLEEATAASLDFAAATGRDLKTAALTVGKAVGAGFTAELTRYGIVLDTSTIPKTEVGAAVLKKLNDQFGGRASAQADTYAGRMKQLGNVVGDVKEAIGRTLIPVLTEFAVKLVPILVKMGTWIDDNRKLVGILIGVGVGGTGLLAALASLGFALSFLPIALAALSGPIGLVIAGLIALAGAAALVFSRQQKLPETIEGVDKALNENRKRIDELKESIGDVGMAQEFWNDIVSRGGRNVDEETLALGANLKELQKLESATAQLAEQKQNLIIIQQQELAFAALVGGETESEIESTDALLAAIRARIAARAAEKAELASLLDVQPIIFATVEEARKGWETLDATVEEKTLNMGEMVDEFGETIGRSFEQAFGDSEQFTNSFVDNMINGFDIIFAAEKNLLNATSQAVGKALLKTIQMSISAAITKILIAKVTEIGKAIIAAPLSFGATLAAIGPIAAGAAVAVGALRALSGRFTPSFEHGGVSPGGFVKTHPGEIIFNPRENSLSDFFAMMRQSPAGAGFAGGNTYVFPSHYGDIVTPLDVNQLAQEIGDEVARVLGGA